MQPAGAGDYLRDGRAGLPPEDEMQASVERIADTDTFRAAPMMRALLLYLWQHHKEAISEYAIAVEALGRRSDFDQRVDATVRVHIGRLRAKLKEVYAGEGKFWPLQLTIPLGSHQLKFVYSSLPSPHASMIPKVHRGHLRAMLWALACGCIALVFACAMLFVENRRLKALKPVSESLLPRFWQSFLSGDKMTSIVVPTPVYMSWPNQELLVRDINVTSYADWSKSPILLEFSKKWGPPKLSLGYFVVNHTLPAVQLLQYLESHGRPAELLASPRLGIDYYRDRNTILMGGPRNTARFQEFLPKRNFQIVTASPFLIRNLNPKPDEPAEYRESAVSDQRITFPGIVALLPRSSEGTGSLVLIARNPTALVAMLLSTEGLQHLDHQWRKHGQPTAWEMVVQAEVHGETVVKVLPVGFRAVM